MLGVVWCGGWGRTDSAEAVDADFGYESGRY